MRWDRARRTASFSTGSRFNDRGRRTKVRFWVIGSAPAKVARHWLTWHLSPKEEVGVSYRRAKASQQFLAGGTTQDEYTFSARKWFAKQYEVQGNVQYESWKVPLYKSGAQSDTTVAVRFTWYPPRRDDK